jgi:hypothetical protein
LPATKKQEKPKPPKTKTVIINGTQHEVSERELTFERVIEMAFGAPEPGVEYDYSVSYQHGHGDKPTGTMAAGGEPVKVRDGMLFNAKRTIRS